MFPPNLNFNLTYLGTDHHIFEDRSEKQRNWGSTEGERSQKFGKKAGQSPKYGYLQISGLGFPTASPGHRNPVLDRSSVPPHTMNSYSTEPEPSHGDLLADRLRHLDILADQPVPVQAPAPSLPKSLHDGYGFRSSSGRTSPRAPTADRNSPLPDVNGLGWPGEPSILFVIHVSSTTTRPLPPSSNHKQSRPCLALTPLPQKKRPAKRDSPPRCAPS
jgi:hypothetical protein